MKLVPDAHKAWRWFSMQAMVLATAVQGAWLFIPDDLRDRVGDDAAMWVTGTILIAGSIGRMVDQDV